MSTRTLSPGRLFFLSPDKPDGGPASPAISATVRLAVLAIVLGAEATALSIQFDNAALDGRHGLAGFVHHWGAWCLRLALGFAALFGTFLWLRNRTELEAAGSLLRKRIINWPLAIGHTAGTLLFTTISLRVYADGAGPSDGLVAAWAFTGIASACLLALALIPLDCWRQLAKGTGAIWALAFGAALVACLIGNYSRSLWVPTTRVTYALSRALLRPLVKTVLADPATATLGTPRFHVEIAPECSGFEGMGLMLAFSILWLFFFRREVRFPRALLLIPAGVVLIYLLNAVRIVALILIGDAGAERIALGGFHSQAGWIAFNVVALGFSLAARQVDWLRKEPAIRKAALVVENPVAPWLMPFITILAAGMLSTSLSGGFEWLYGLRVLAAACVLWHFRQVYTPLERRVSLAGFVPGLVTGCGVFAIWILTDRSGGSDAIPAALGAASVTDRAVWIALRFLGGAVTVPIAEELAFRGFLLRRLIQADFEAVLPGRQWVAFAISSVAFGFLHGDRWVAGAVAGFAYALVYARRGRIGDAIVAHAVTNALLGIDVVAFHHWHLW